MGAKGKPLFIGLSHNCKFQRVGHSSKAESLLDSLVVAFAERENIMHSSRHAKGTAATAGLLALTAAALSTAQPAQAQLTLTPAGTALGLGLTTFATGFPNAFNVGPLGIAFPNAGGVLVSDYPGNVRLFPTDTNGQNAASVPVAQNYGQSNALGLANDGGKHLHGAAGQQ